MENHKVKIERAWDARENLSKTSSNFKETKAIIDEVISFIEKGEVTVTEKEGRGWKVNEWVKKAILLNFKTSEMKIYDGGVTKWYDKIDPRFADDCADDFTKGGYRVVPGAYIRSGTYIGKNAVIMPSYVNIGAYVGAGTLVDTWATVGSCARIGKNCHISGGAGIGGVLEPLQASPVIIEDNCFIGARSEIVEGVIVEQGAVISMGVFIGASTKIVNRQTGEVSYGRVPAYSVVVPGTLPGKREGEPGLYCAVIIKQVDEKTRSKTSLNELLRD